MLDIQIPAVALAHPLASNEEGDLVQLTLAEGRVVSGSFIPRGGLYFLHQAGQGLPPQGVIIGPIQAEDCQSVQMLKSATAMAAEQRERLLGVRVPGRAPVTAQDFAYRLQTLAMAVVFHRGELLRGLQLQRQFHSLADQIELGKAKRAWLLAEARWVATSNQLPTMRDLWGEDVASPSCFARPRPQDFHPDPAIRRRRAQLPDYVRRDPFSITNMVHALQDAGLKARVTRLGDPPWDRGHLQIDLPLRGRAQFIAKGARQDDGKMHWAVSWNGNESEAGRRRYRRAVALGYTALVRSVLERGRAGVPGEA